MNKLGYFGIGILLGGIGGFFVGRYVTKEKAEKEANARADAEIDEMRDYYNIGNTYINNGDDAGINEESEDQNESRENGIMAPEARNKLKAERRAAHEAIYNKTMYNKMYKDDEADSEHPVDSDEDEVEHYMDKVADERKSNSGKSPKIISERALGEVPEYYDSQTLYYYMYDHTLVDDADNVVDEPGYLIGDALTKYGFIDDGNEETLIFVRNSELDTIYEIQKMHAAWYDEEDV